jgi:hypothetical protein
MGNVVGAVAVVIGSKFRERVTNNYAFVGLALFLLTFNYYLLLNNVLINENSANWLQSTASLHCFR